MPYQVKAGGAVPTPVYLIVDRGQNSGAGLARTILATSYHQNSDKVKYCPVTEYKIYTPTNTSSSSKQAKKTKTNQNHPNLDGGRYSRYIQNKMKNASPFMYMS